VNDEALVLKEVEVLAVEKLFDRQVIDPILERIKIEVLAIPSDISTPNGRKALASLAFKVAKTKTFIEDRHRDLVYKEKQRLGAIDAEWKRIRETLDGIKTAVRKPLTDWEEIEETRVHQHEIHITRLEDAKKLRVDASTADIIARIAQLEADDISQMEEFDARAMTAKAESLEYLKNWLARSQKADTERAELDRLRKEREDRERAEREKQVAENARKQAEDRAARQVQDANDAAARAERALADAQARSAREAEEAVERERQRLAAADRQATYEAEQREMNRQHCSKINNAALEALVAGGISQKAAKTVVQLIVKGQVPNVRITY
jgi:hypothetical protein